MSEGGWWGDGGMSGWSFRIVLLVAWGLMLVGLCIVNLR